MPRDSSTCRTITATARRISASNLQERPALDGADEEFKDRGDTLDELFSRLEAAFEAQRHFVANASHELRPSLLFPDREGHQRDIPAIREIVAAVIVGVLP